VRSGKVRAVDESAGQTSADEGGAVRKDRHAAARV
jgi:hypothetical protein